MLEYAGIKEFSRHCRPAKIVNFEESDGALAILAQKLLMLF